MNIPSIPRKFLFPIGLLILFGIASSANAQQQTQHLEVMRWYPKPSQTNRQRSQVRQAEPSSKPATARKTVPSTEGFDDQHNEEPNNDSAVKEAEYVESEFDTIPEEVFETHDAIECDELPPNMGTVTRANCDRRCRQNEYWAIAEYLHFSLEGGEAPALVTTSRDGTARNDAGVLGLATTTVLLGQDTIGDGDYSGGRFELGHWFPGSNDSGIHVAYIRIGSQASNASFDSSSTPILARPFFSVNPDAVGQNAELIAFPGEVEGNVSFAYTTSLDGAEIMLRHQLIRGCTNLQFLGGYQYSRLQDEMSIRDLKNVIGGGSGLAIGTTLAEDDYFESKNEFHGAVVGFIRAARSGQWTSDIGMQMALGSTQSRIRIDGSTTASVPTVSGGTDVSTTDGGLLALPSNIGTYDDQNLTVVPQLHVRLGCYLNPRLRATIGYRFLYWSQVARAVEQIDTSVNLSQLDPSGISGEQRPAFDLQLSDFWAHGLNAGLALEF